MDKKIEVYLMQIKRGLRLPEREKHDVVEEIVTGFGQLVLACYCCCIYAVCDCKLEWS